jgi:hypothetical protein
MPGLFNPGISFDPPPMPLALRNFPEGWGSRERLHRLTGRFYIQWNNGLIKTTPALLPTQGRSVPDYASYDLSVTHPMF